MRPQLHVKKLHQKQQLCVGCHCTPINLSRIIIRQPLLAQPHPSWIVRSSSTDEAEAVDVGWLWSMGTSGQASTTKASLRSESIKAKKSLGQNFLTDEKILADIVATAAIKNGELVIEVGPGTGNLTRHLVKTGGNVTAIEKDDVLYGKLQTMFQETDLKLINGDVLRINLDEYVEKMLEEHGQKGSKVKIVANLPYNITKEFLQLVLPLGDRISDVHIMIQDEVAKRLLQTKPGGKVYRSINIFTMFYSQPRYRFRIPKTKYYPVPGVDGALVTFRLRPPSARLPVPTEKYFLMLVNKAFSERRKMMRNSLQPLVTTEQAEQALVAIGLPAESRAQDLTVDQFAAFARHVHQLQSEQQSVDSSPQDVPDDSTQPAVIPS